MSELLCHPIHFALGAELQSRLEILSHAGAGLGCLVYGAILVGRDDRLELHRRMGLFLIVLGAGMLGRAVFWATCTPWLGHAMLGAFGLFPLLLALAFEALLHRSLQLIAKLALLAGTGFFVGTCWTDVALLSGWWSMALIGYHSAIVAYLGALAALAGLRYRRSLRAAGPRRSLYGATVLVCAVAVALMFTDWAHVFGLDLPRLGAVPALLVLFLGGALLHSSGDWRLRSSLERLGMILVAGALLGVLVGTALAGCTLENTLITMGVLAAAAMICEPVRKHVTEVRSGRLDLLMDRIVRLPVSSPGALVAALAAWPELERVCYLPAGELALDSPDAVVRRFERDGTVLSRADLTQRMAVESSAQLFVLEQIQHVMDSHRVDYLGLASHRGDLIGVRLGVGPEPDLYRRVLAIVVNMLRQHGPAGTGPRTASTSSMEA